jgi:hypothetical protein
MSHPCHMSYPDAQSDEKTWSPTLVPLLACPNEKTIVLASILLHHLLDATLDEETVGSKLNLVTCLVPMGFMTEKQKALGQVPSQARPYKTYDGKTRNTSKPPKNLSATPQSLK